MHRYAVLLYPTYNFWDTEFPPPLGGGGLSFGGKHEREMWKQKKEKDKEQM